MKNSFMIKFLFLGHGKHKRSFDWQALDSHRNCSFYCSFHFSSRAEAVTIAVKSRDVQKFLAISYRKYRMFISINAVWIFATTAPLPYTPYFLRHSSFLTVFPALSSSERCFSSSSLFQTFRCIKNRNQTQHVTVRLIDLRPNWNDAHPFPSFSTALPIQFFYSTISCSSISSFDPLMDFSEARLNEKKWTGGERSKSRENGVIYFWKSITEEIDDCFTRGVLLFFVSTIMAL